MSETETLTAARIPTVYFIDDSATMREVIKIAFRKENIHVITCPDAASALGRGFRQLLGAASHVQRRSRPQVIVTVRAAVAKP